jgi:hypothetical protein
MKPEDSSLPIDSKVLIAHPALNQDVTAIAQDPDLATAFSKFDFAAFGSEFKNFTQQLMQHNAFHTRETRLWSLKLGTARVAPALEQQLKDSAPQALQNFQAAFLSLGNCADHITNAGLDRVLEKHSDVLTSRYTFDEANPFGQATMSYFRTLGFSTPMIEEFKSSYKATNCEFIKNLGGGKFAQVREVSSKGVEARVEILKYTHENGLAYIRGGGPPAWAVTVSSILASVGIVISAWVIVAIIVSLIVLLGVLCITHVLPLGACQTLSRLGVIPIVNGKF